MGEAKKCFCVREDGDCKQCNAIIRLPNGVCATEEGHTVHEDGTVSYRIEWHNMKPAKLGRITLK